MPSLPQRIATFLLVALLIVPVLWQASQPAKDYHRNEVVIRKYTHLPIGGIVLITTGSYQSVGYDYRGVYWFAPSGAMSSVFFSKEDIENGKAWFGGIVDGKYVNKLFRLLPNDKLEFPPSRSLTESAKGGRPQPLFFLYSK